MVGWHHQLYGHDFEQAPGEMATIGVTMAGIVTGVWVAMCLAADAIVKRSPKATAEKAPV